MQYAVCSMQYAVCSMQYAVCSVKCEVCIGQWAATHKVKYIIGLKRCKITTHIKIEYNRHQGRIELINN